MKQTLQTLLGATGNGPSTDESESGGLREANPTTDPELGEDWPADTADRQREVLSTVFEASEH
jgi:hypothetical protein